MANKFFTSTAFITIASLAGVGLGIFGYTKISKKIKEKQAENNGNQVDNTKDPKKGFATTFAQRCYSAFFPSGYPSLWDGTDEAALFAVAKDMYSKGVTFAYLTEAYKKLYNRTFVADLSDELDSSDLAKFYAIIQKGFAGLGSTNTNLL